MSLFENQQTTELLRVLMAAKENSSVRLKGGRRGRRKTMARFGKGSEAK
jgi:hypothetical protein